jgi:hypothetical protein
MSTTIENQQEAAEKFFYAAVGAPVVFGQKAKDFTMALFNDITLEDLESAGREFAHSLQESKVVEQIQETVDYEQFQEKVDLLREQLETLLTSWRDQFDPSVKSVKIEVEDKAPAKTASGAKKTAAKKAAPKKSTSDA